MADSLLVYSGKSKDVYRITDGAHAGKYRLLFTDKATGYLDNGTVVFDPGRDEVVGEVPGKGAIACRFATHFFRLLKARQIPSHYIDTIGDNEMIVEPAAPLSLAPEIPSLPGAEPLLNLEFTWRNSATGSFWRRYPFVKPCKNLDRVVEVWTKGKSDVLITTEALQATGALTRDELTHCVDLVRQVAEIVSREFASKGLHALDGKFELGRLKGGDGQIVIIDEISPDVLRVCSGYTPAANGDCAVCETCAITRSADGERSIQHRRQVAASDFVSIFL
ncbi:MAG TPA: phosphoribosylaminoimidazolesuccinocarboxamide synthase [Vicinamibacterales bacterium]|nr:phosphoribosylaminoimidazolesuccinocarboxamide synthase [Vicinamibacterales bacterium]HPW22078.1 phosphoribosylaminoimidazolesuccinocarboxamide synthase [Vicinamibacterales bacterium]